MLKNYTSSVPVDRTISRIEAALAKAGASCIVKEYAPGTGTLAALYFKVAMPDSTNEITIRLPVNTVAIYTLLRERVKHLRRGTTERLQEQALRTSWKLMQDMVEIQLTFIQMKQTTVLEAFLSYIWDGKQTFFNRLRTDNYRALPETTKPLR